MYSPDKPFKVYDRKEWWSDGWDAMEYGRGFDSSRTFFEQFGELFREVPQVALYVAPDMMNSDFCNYGQTCKNCYLCVNTYEAENCFYTHTASMHIHSIVDGYWNVTSSDTYASEYIYGSASMFYSSHCRDCRECWYCMDCTNCQYCIGCTNLVNQQYHIRNKKASPEEYRDMLARIHQDDTLRDIHDFLRQSPRRAVRHLRCEDCTGDGLQDSRDVQESFDVMSTEEGKFLHLSGYYSHAMYDGVNVGGYSDHLYEGHHVHGIRRSGFVLDSDESSDVFYVRECFSCTDCFGCIGLRNKQYCILNTQYTKEEYENLVPKIIARMREI